MGKNRGIYLNGEPIFGPEHKVDPKDQPRGTWKEEQAAAYLGLKASTLRQWRFHSKGPAYLKISRSIRYRKEDLDEFMEKSIVRPVA